MGGGGHGAEGAACTRKSHRGSSLKGDKGRERTSDEEVENIGSFLFMNLLRISFEAEKREGGVWG